MKEINAVVATNIKRIRKEKQLTLQELSLLCDVSVSMIGGIEREESNPTINVLQKIANGLKLPLQFLIKDNSEYLSVVTYNERAVKKKTDFYLATSIFEYNEKYGFEVLELEIEPNGNGATTGHVKGVIEFIIVTEGQVKLEVEGKNVVLEKGDALRFEADKPHVIWNAQEEVANVMNIIYYSRY